MDNKLNLKQLQVDLNSLSDRDFEAKYPGLANKPLKGLSMEELEQRISKGGLWDPFINTIIKR